MSGLRGCPGATLCLKCCLCVEASARIEEDRFATEEMYHKKLAIVKGATEKRAESVSVQATEEMGRGRNSSGDGDLVGWGEGALVRQEE